MLPAPGIAMRLLGGLPDAGSVQILWLILCG
jgi:hypothetical protein